MAIYNFPLSVTTLTDIGTEVLGMRWSKDDNGIRVVYRLSFNPTRPSRRWDLIRWHPSGGEISLGTFVHLGSAIEAVNREIGHGV